MQAHFADFILSHVQTCQLFHGKVCFNTRLFISEGASVVPAGQTVLINDELFKTKHTKLNKLSNFLGPQDCSVYKIDGSLCFARSADLKIIADSISLSSPIQIQPIR